MKFLKTLLLFSLGGGCYVGLELLYRGYSHLSMYAAGGLCFLLLGRLRTLPLHPLLRVAAGAGIITAVELTVGLLVNRDYQIWDYRDQPGNLLGQICPAFVLLWATLAAVGMAFYGRADRLLDRLLGLCPGGC